MRVESLACFLAILESGSFRQAAEKIYISQQGLSKVIKNLETELGSQLFERSGKKITVTEAGKLLEPYARTIVNTRSEFDEKLLSLQAVETGVLPDSFSILTTPLALRTMTRIKDTLRSYSLYDIRILERSLSKTVKVIRESESAEIAFVDILSEDAGSFFAKHEDLTYVGVFSIPLTILGSRDLLSSYAPDISLEKLKHIPIADYDVPIKRKLLDRLFGADASNIRMQVSDSTAIDDLLISGKAATISDLISDRYEAKRLDLMSITLPWLTSTTIGFMHRKDISINDEQRVYIQRFKKMAAENFGEFSVCEDS